MAPWSVRWLLVAAAASTAAADRASCRKQAPWLREAQSFCQEF
jgi:hypothetical protein